MTVQIVQGTVQLALAQRIDQHMQSLFAFRVTILQRRDLCLQRHIIDGHLTAALLLLLYGERIVTVGQALLQNAHGFLAGG